jgi:peptidoglycan-associated lipoprotein
MIRQTSSRFAFRAIASMALATGLAMFSVSGCSSNKQSATLDPTTQTPAGPGGDRATDLDPSVGDAADTGLRDIFFAYDSHALDSAARPILSSNAAHLRDRVTGPVTIEGHCDERGTVEYNLALGQRRAEAARNYLIDLGIDPDKLVTVSYGEERPDDPGSHESAWAKNRRAHFRIDLQ